MSAIFICYRRDDSQPTTRAIYERLIGKYGKAEVFLDIGIPYGVDFETYARENIEKAEAVLVMIGKEWLKLVEENGVRRLDNPDDFVRREIEEAFKQEKAVLPVTLEHDDMPKRMELPESIAKLATLNAASVHTNRHFDGEMEWLQTWIDLQIEKRDARRAAAQEIERQRLAAEESARNEREQLERAQREAEARKAAAMKISQPAPEKAHSVPAASPAPATNPTRSLGTPTSADQSAQEKPKSQRRWLEILGTTVGVVLVCGFGLLAIWMIWHVASYSADYAVHYLNDSLRNPLSAGTSGILTVVLTIAFIPVICWIIKLIYSSN
jgi:hypothetical protein